MDEAMEKMVKETRRNCLLCRTRRSLRPTDKEREIALRGVKNLCQYFLEQFQHLRKIDGDAAEIRRANGDRRLCLDLLDECRDCDKEVDCINRGLLKIK